MKPVIGPKKLSLSCPGTWAVIVLGSGSQSWNVWLLREECGCSSDPLRGSARCRITDQPGGAMHDILLLVAASGGWGTEKEWGAVVTVPKWSPEKLPRSCSWLPALQHREQSAICFLRSLIIIKTFPDAAFWFLSTSPPDISLSNIQGSKRKITATVKRKERS